VRVMSFFSNQSMFTIRAIKLSKVLRIERNTFLKIVQSRVVDEVIIMDRIKFFLLLKNIFQT